MIRKTVITILSLAIIAAAYFIYQDISEKENAPRPKKSLKITQVYTELVKNGPMPISLRTSGTLRAKNRMEIYAEVSGKFESSAHSFKPGVYYAEGETLVSIDSEQQKLNLRAQRSNLYNQLVQMLPDLRFDFTESVGQWEAYIDAFDIDQDLRSLPEPVNTKEKLFVASRNVTTTFYNIKNLEEQLRRHVIRAPYNGILIESMIEPGTAINIGQQLGTFINPYRYELEIAINTSYNDFLKVGKSVQLHDVNRTKSWSGKVGRINSTVDPSSQTIPVFVDVKGSDLKEGMYLEADLSGKEEQNVYEINRKLLVGDDGLFIVKDTLLDLVQIEPIHFKDETVLVRGLAEGTKLLSYNIPGAHVGMIVEEISE